MLSLASFEPAIKGIDIYPFRIEVVDSPANGLTSGMI